MPSESNQTYYPLTSTVIFRTLQKIIEGKDSVAQITEAISEKEQNVWVYVKILGDEDLIVIESREEDKRIKKYTPNMRGILSFYLKWVDANRPLKEKDKDQFLSNKSFTNEFDWYIEKQLPKLRVENLERAFLSFSTNLIMNYKTRQTLRESFRVQAAEGKTKLEDVVKKIEREIQNLSSINEILSSVVFGGPNLTNKLPDNSYPGVKL
ncbi:MAG: hypothetical protein Q8P05_02800 [Candidatus Diapherotrites archaeon]|nr:hypothetical protein [Candidatus Diapherotrites archaeon]